MHAGVLGGKKSGEKEGPAKVFLEDWPAWRREPRESGGVKPSENSDPEGRHWPSVLVSQG